MNSDIIRASMKLLDEKEAILKTKPGSKLREKFIGIYRGIMYDEEYQDMVELLRIEKAIFVNRWNYWET